MSDSYQAIYDAVRSRISGGNIGDAVRDVAFQAFDISNMTAYLQQEFCSAAYEMQRPSVVFKPTLSVDGDMWCALLGTDLVTGLAAFGETPAAAMLAFDKAFREERTPAAAKQARIDNGQFGVGA